MVANLMNQWLLQEVPCIIKMNSNNKATCTYYCDVMNNVHYLRLRIIEATFFGGGGLWHRAGRQPFYDRWVSLFGMIMGYESEIATHFRQCIHSLVQYHTYKDGSQCGNLEIFLTGRFHVKTISWFYRDLNFILSNLCNSEIDFT